MGREGWGRRASDLFFLKLLYLLSVFLYVGPQSIAKYLKYFAFSKICEAVGRAATEGSGTL